MVTHPTNVNVMYVGSTNGGIWRTANAMATSPDWTPLTDYLPNQSIGALVLDPSDVTSSTLVAGLGGNSSFGLSSGELQGLLRTTDGGSTWAQLGTPFFAGQSISGLAARGNLILAASNPFRSNGGVSRSTNAGLSWTTVSGTSGLPTGGAFDLVEDPTSAARFYVSTQSGIFRTNDSGASWTNVSPAGNQSRGRPGRRVEPAVGRRQLGLEHPEPGRRVRDPGRRPRQRHLGPLRQQPEPRRGPRRLPAPHV